MKAIYIVLIAIGVLTLIFLSFLYVCFFLTFYITNRQKKIKEDELPTGEIYKPYHSQMLQWMREVRELKQEEITVTAYDGKKLYGKYYEHFEGAPVEIMFHGYRGSAERDLCGGIQRCRELGRNVLVVDQRGHGRSDGHVLSFGIKERYDVKTWAEYMDKRFNGKVKLILTGISMGAATVCMASSFQYPKSVVGIIADCGYDSVKEIIKVVIKKMRLSVKLFYPAVRLSALIFGGFDLEQTTVTAELEKSTLPVIFMHGDSDDFVPCYMGEHNYKACTAPKAFEVFEGAGHGLAYLANPQRYISALKDFEKYYE